MSKKDTLSIENRIKRFTLNDTINEYHDFLNYFYKLSDKDKNIIINICLKNKKYYTNIKNANIDKIYNMYMILLHKMQYNELNFKEKMIYEHITYYLIINSEFENNKYFSMYSDKYLNYNFSQNKSKKIFLILQDVLDSLNKKYNKSYKIKLSTENYLAFTNWIDKDKVGKVLFGQKFLDELNKYEKTNISINNVLPSCLFILLHEYKHLLQMDDFYISSSISSSKYLMDVFIVSEMNNFYGRYHDYITIEKEANEFAYNTLFEYIERYIKFSEFNFSKDNLRKEIIENFNVFPRDNKKILLLYNLIEKYINLSYKMKIKNVDNFYNEIHTLKKEYRETHLED